MNTISFNVVQRLIKKWENDDFRHLVRVDWKFLDIVCVFGLAIIMIYSIKNNKLLKRKPPLCARAL